MAFRVPTEKFNEIGVFAKLTSAYCIVSEFESKHLYSALKRGLPRNFPVVETSLADCKIIGRMCVGNRHGLLVPSLTSDAELKYLRSVLPDSVEIRRTKGTSALGNLMVCNDHVALVNSRLYTRKMRELIEDTLLVEVQKSPCLGGLLIGTHCVLSNQGGLLFSEARVQDIIGISGLVQVPLVAGTVNDKRRDVGSVMIVNEHCAFVGKETTDGEMELIKDLFWFERTVASK